MSASAPPGGGEAFALAEMSRGIRLLTFALLALPAALLAAGLRSDATAVLLPTSLFVVAVYAFIWLWMRPTCFVVRNGGLELVWPWRRKRIEPGAIASVEPVTLKELRAQSGFLMRVGAGGLWGGFGMLWSSRKRHMDFYISRLDGWVLIRRYGARPLLISPELPERFIESLRAALG